MARCPKCRHQFRVLEDEDDGQHGCPSCGYGDRAEDHAPALTEARSSSEAAARKMLLAGGFTALEIDAQLSAEESRAKGEP